MNLDLWPLITVLMVVLASMRPAWAAMQVGTAPPDRLSRHGLTQAGGGAAMLAMAAYLVTQYRTATGSGFWDLPMLALSSPYMRALPAAWLPALCWAGLVGLGAWWLFVGIRGLRPSRDVACLIGAVNEVAVVSTLLLWHVTVPDTWARAALLGFALQGVYVSYLAGAALRLVLAVVSFALPPLKPSDGREHRVNSSLRRF